MRKILSRFLDTKSLGIFCSLVAIAAFVGCIMSIGAMADGSTVINMPNTTISGRLINFDLGGELITLTLSEGPTLNTTEPENNFVVSGTPVYFELIGSNVVDLCGNYEAKLSSEGWGEHPLSCDSTNSKFTPSSDIDFSSATGGIVLQVQKINQPTPPTPSSVIVGIATDTFNSNNNSATFNVNGSQKTITFTSKNFTVNNNHAEFVFDDINSPIDLRNKLLDGLTFETGDNTCISNSTAQLVSNEDQEHPWTSDFVCSDGTYTLAIGSGAIPTSGLSIQFHNNQQPVENEFNIFYDNVNDGATSNNINFTVGEATVGLTLSGMTFVSDGQKSVVNHNDLFAENSQLYYTVSDNFDPQTMKIVIRGDNNYQDNLEVVNGQARFSGKNAPGDSVHLTIEAERGDDPDTRPHHPGVPVNASVTVSSSDDNHKGSFSEARIFINGEDVSFSNCDPKTDGSCTNNNFVYNYDAENDNNKVTIRLGALFITKFVNKVTINNVDYTIPVDYANKLSCLTYYGNQEIGFEFQIAKADSYDIVADTEEIKPNEHPEETPCIGNFLWSNSEEDKGKDEYIGHSVLVPVRVVWDPEDGGDPIVIEGDDIYNGPTEAQRNRGMVLEYGFDSNTGTGSLVTPAQAELTMKITPEYGYQITSFGINDSIITTGEAISEFTFPVGNGNFHLGAEVKKVDDLVASETDKVEGGLIELGGLEIGSGTALLTVSDADISEDQISNFQSAASGYEVSTFLDINLDQVFFKGNDEEYWNGEELKNLTHEATVTLKLAEGVNGNTVVIVHEKHDGTYEVIPTVYDTKTHTITFKTSSFSNYAIASTTTANANTRDKIIKYVLILAASLAVSIFCFTKAKQTVKQPEESK